MLLEGKFHRVGKNWIAEIPLLSTTVSHPKIEHTSDDSCKTSLIAVMKEISHQNNLDLEFIPKGEHFFIKVKDIDSLLPIILKRARLARGLSMGDVTKRLGYSSRNSYAQYEYGKTKLTFSKYLELMQAINPDLNLVLGTNLLQ